MKKQLWLIALLVVAALPSWLIWVAMTAYISSPGMVTELDRAGLLPLSPSELPRNRMCALLVADNDTTFYRHHGIGLADGHLGHTTITQSIGKGLFFSGFSPGPLRYRKIRLMVSAWAFDRRVSKETQLRIFLNRTYFGSAGGQEVIGFPAAASTFYGRSLGQLSDLEFFSLLAMLESPSRYHVILQPKLNSERVARIRDLVRRACGEGCFQGDAPVPCATTDVRS